MEFEEVFTSPFTTQTTCYSCGRKRIAGDYNSKNNFSLQFATENHILGARMLVETTTGGSNDDIKTSCRPLPRDSAKLICVGYANWEEEQEESTKNNDMLHDSNNENSTFTTVRHIEAMALIDVELIEGNESSSSTANLHRPSASVIERDDNTSVATSTIDGRVQMKRSSTSTTVSGTTTNSPLSSGSYHRKSQSELSKGSHTSISDTQQSFHNNNSILNIETEKSKNDKVLLTQQKSRARLVLKQDQYSIRRSLSSSTTASNKAEEKCDENLDGTDDQICRRQLRQSSFALLDFRPLCPCIAKWGEGHRNTKEEANQDDDSFLGIWVGSADDAVLRLYAPSQKDSRSLVSVALPEEHFSVDSPVMALDFCSIPSSGETSTKRTKLHTLAVACQDGTIQLITWTDHCESNVDANKDSKKPLFKDIASQKVIVDGPLVCLKLDYNIFASLRVIVGSLCGFVCQLIFDFNNKPSNCLSESFWEGPHMVVEDLFHSSINIEESVLTVDTWDNYVAVGTQLGRCLLYATYDSENYFLVWQVVLPYPVHDIVIITTNAMMAGHPIQESIEEEKKSSIHGLAVTTRRSFHVFRVIFGGVAWRQKPKWEEYSSELARIRLVEILERIRKENQASNFATRKCVLETLEDLLENVETATKNNNFDGLNDDLVVVQQSISNVFSGTISNLIDHVEEHVEEHIEEKLETNSPPLETNSPPIDAPHWEYSSSDEEEEEVVQSLSTGTKEEEDS